MTKVFLREGIAAYADQQKHLLSFLSDWVDQDDFDRHARSIGGVNMYGGKPRVLVPGAFMLGTLQSSGPAAEWLHLMQIMMQLDLIEAKEEQGKVWYRAVSLAGLFHPNGFIPAPAIDDELRVEEKNASLECFDLSDAP